MDKLFGSAVSVLQLAFSSLSSSGRLSGKLHKKFLDIFIFLMCAGMISDSICLDQESHFFFPESHAFALLARLVVHLNLLRLFFHEAQIA
ncbi:hypothetical protein [Candidatus Symbiopectobacterium sp. 'North America']|uniref:hypothetical protein n=1 Tax=Candidatus Symbiopectobacterium sp. 'North America' TaxID=2794574 RepID=UPI0018CB5033|nr:hypothetical protein [Candidatus Symbiopectobacterium sp. 'North America']